MMADTPDSGGSGATAELQPREGQAMDRTCPDGAALIIKGEHFPCQTMRDMAPESDSHEGWAHSNRDAEAIWQ